MILLTSTSLAFPNEKKSSGISFCPKAAIVIVNNKILSENTRFIPIRSFVSIVFFGFAKIEYFFHFPFRIVFFFIAKG